MAREAEDYEIRNQVRSILAKFWINNDKLNVGVHRGNVNVFGVLEQTSTVGRSIDELKTMAKIAGESTNQTMTKAQIVKAASANLTKKIAIIEQEIHGIHGVRCVTLEFQ